MGACSSTSAAASYAPHSSSSSSSSRETVSGTKSKESNHTQAKGTSVAANTEEMERFRGIKRGMKLLCMDTFVSKYTGETMHKWRDAEVRIWDGYKKTSKVMIHYTGWSDKYDKWIDLDSPTEMTQICPLDVMPQKQEEMGIALTLSQQFIVREFLETGEVPEVTQMHGEHPPHEAEPSPTATSARAGYTGPFSKDMKIDVQDVFTRNSKVTPSKWREAVVLDVVGQKLRVHYLGLGHDFDEVLDLSKEGHRVAQAGKMSKLGSRPSLKKSKTVSTANAHSRHLRQARRSFDSSPIQRQPKGSDWSLEGDAETTSYDDDQSPISPTSWDMSSSGVTSPNTSSVSLLEDETPAMLLRNKEAPQKMQRNRTVSFTSKNGKVVPGAAVGLHRSEGNSRRRHSSSGLEVGARVSSELAFADRLEGIGLHIVPIEPDGNCLFRALSHQLYCTEDRHAELRSKCVAHMQAHRDRFEIFCTSDFDGHCRRMSMDGTWASELEIRALEEIMDRLFSIYSSDDKSFTPMPMQTNFDEIQLLGKDVTPVKLSYHNNHYNSLFDQKKEFPLGERSGSTLLKARVKLFRSV